MDIGQIVGIVYLILTLVAIAGMTILARGQGEPRWIRAGILTGIAWSPWLLAELATGAGRLAVWLWRRLRG